MNFVRTIPAALILAALLSCEAATGGSSTKTTDTSTPTPVTRVAYAFGAFYDGSSTGHDISGIDVIEWMSDGSFNLVEGSGVTIPGETLMDLAVNLQGSILFVVAYHSNELREYTISSQGKLELKATFALNMPTDVAVSPDNDLIAVHYGDRGQNRIKTWHLAYDGTLTDADDIALTGAYYTQGLAFEPWGNTLSTVEPNEDRIRQVAVASDGTLTAAAHVPTGGAVQTLSYSISRQRAWATGEGNILAFTVNDQGLLVRDADHDAPPAAGVSSGEGYWLTQLPNATALFAGSYLGGTFLARWSVATDGTLAEQPALVFSTDSTQGSYGIHFSYDGSRALVRTWSGLASYKSTGSTWVKDGSALATDLVPSRPVPEYPEDYWYVDLIILEI